MCIHLIRPPESSFDRIFPEGEQGRKHADDHRRRRSWGASDLDVHCCHLPHLLSQTQEQEAGEGAHCEEVCDFFFLMRYEERKP